jgi:hypothetical protein
VPQCAARCGCTGARGAFGRHVGKGFVSSQPGTWIMEDAGVDSGRSAKYVTGRNTFRSALGHM